jgi:hypothetical protein
MGHQRRSRVDGMSAVASIATELLREGNGRKGPLADIVEITQPPRRRLQAARELLTGQARLHS